jgi:hypothetical protein
VRYFSGTATYEKDIEVPADRLAAGRELWLDLGAVKNFAEVSLNGQNLDVLWKPPFRVNLTAVAKPGANHLVVKVTNLWPNRLIGDEQLPPDVQWNGKQLKAWPQWFLDGKPSPTGRLMFTTWHHWTKDSPLLESGLLGPVTLRTAEIIRVNLGGAGYQARRFLMLARMSASTSPFGFAPCGPPWSAEHCFVSCLLIELNQVEQCSAFRYGTTSAIQTRTSSSARQRQERVERTPFSGGQG